MPVARASSLSWPGPLVSGSVRSSRKAPSSTPRPGLGPSGAAGLLPADPGSSMPARSGVNVIITYRDENQANDAIAEITDMGVKGGKLRLDVTDFGGYGRFADN